MIITTLIGGLGNQLFQYAFARQIALAQATNVKLDLTALENDPHRTLRLNYFNVKASIANAHETEKLRSAPIAQTTYQQLLKLITFSKHRLHRTYFKEAEYYHYEKNWTQLSTDVLLEGFWQHHQYYQNVDQSIKNELTLKEHYTANAPAIVNEIAVNKGSVSLHIRRGDYVTDLNNKNYFGVLPLEYYHGAIDLLNTRHDNLTFYIFSDDLIWAKDNLKLSVPIKFVEIGDGSSDYLELYAMSLCRHNIIANSSFSWWGAFLNKNPGHTVICPARWIADPDLNKQVQIQLPSWIKL